MTAFDTNSQQYTNDRTCRPLVIRKLVDRTTPLFAHTWGTNDTTTTFRLSFYSGGSEYFRITLTDARVVAISRAGGEADAVPSEQISFAFPQVEYTHIDGGTSYVYSCAGAPPA